MAAESSSGVALDAQYGGNSDKGWLGLLPSTWLPYVQLARLSPPAGLFLTFFPHLFGILHAGILSQQPPKTLLYTTAVISGGSFFVSNAIHIWNDLIDAPLDAQVERTKHRPIPRGAVSQRAALIFTLSQALFAALFLPLCDGPGPLQGSSTLYALPGIVSWTYYPWAKRHTDYPQFILGFCLAWGIVMGEVAARNWGETSLDALSELHSQVFTGSTLCLLGACILWTMIYDTIYAQQDLESDIKVGIKSLAVRFEGRTKQLLTILLVAMTVLLIACGRLSSMGPVYFTLTVGGATTSLGLMIRMVDLSNSVSCWLWFSSGFWLTGGAISAGLVAEYMVQGQRG